MTKENAPILSIVIPVYNAEKYLNYCIDSILKQNNSDVEIILIDDGSTDNSGTICDEYSSKNPNIKTIHQKNLGVATARNVGMKSSSGKYIQFLDNDDWINKGEISKLIETIANTNADIIIHKYYLSGKKISIGNEFVNANEINGKNKEQVLNYLRKGRINITAPWEYSFKKEIVEKNKIEFESTQNAVDDSVFTPILFINSSSFYFDKRPFISWRMRPDSQGSSQKRKDFMVKMISTINSLKQTLETATEEYKKNYLLYRIYKNIYSLIGPYYEYSETDRPFLNKWYIDNKNLIKKSSKYSGFIHKILVVLLGAFYGTILSYKLATLKGHVFMLLYKK